METDQLGPDMEELQAEKLFKAGDIIMREGEMGQCAWLIQSGRVSIFIHREDGHVIEVGSRGPGSIIGEMAIVDDQPRSATVQAIEDCRVLEVSKNDYTRSVNAAHPIIRLVSQVILARYRDVLSRAHGLADSTPRLEQQELDYAAQSNVVDAVRMNNEFKVAIAGGQLRLKYQPMLALDSGRVVGFEALMRWQHPVRGEISPADFIPMAEDSGLIVEASRWALREACEALHRMEKAADVQGEQLFMSVNFSAADFEDPGFLSLFQQTLEETGTDPHRIHLEIIERVLIRPFGGARGLLEQFRAMGVEVAIDDFGTGYSSLNYLHQYPINTLKIDQSFIRDMCDDEMSRRLVRSILTLSRDLDMTTVAEGVETEAQVRLLREMNCDIVQGYHYAHPMDEKALVALLRRSGQGWEATGNTNVEAR
ncbi:MAG: EAL domain-containing protein [Pseudohongiellaceae bacterium]